METMGLALSREQNRQKAFCAMVFDALTCLEDMSWMDGHHRYVKNLFVKHGEATVRACLLFHASYGSTPPVGETAYSFDFPEPDSFLAMMYALGKARLEPDLFSAICRVCRIREDLSVGP